MRLSIACLLLSSLLPFGTVQAATAVQPVTPVAQLDLARYAGTWHEIARLPMFFQRNCASNVTATYTALPDGLIEVDNACLRADGRALDSKGVARTVAGSPGKLEVRFAPAFLSGLPLVWADYWVIALDPDYRWAMVGRPDRKYLWILSREPRIDPALMSDLQARAIAMGYKLDGLVVSPAMH